MKKYFFTGIILLFAITSCTKEQKSIDKVNTDQNYDKTVQQKENTIKVGKGPDALFLTPDENHLYVANVGDDFISVINTKQEKVVSEIKGIKYPWGFTRLGNSNLVAVSGYNKQIVIINFEEHKIIREKKFKNNLGGITSTINGKYIYVIETGKDKALKLDASSLKILNSFDTGSGPDGIGISEDNNKIYTTNTIEGNISVINTRNKSTKLLNVGGKPELVHYNRDHSLLFISNFLLNKIHIIDTETDKIIYEITNLISPEEAVLSKSEKLLYIVNFGAERVFVYDAKTYKKLNKEYSVGNKPIGIISALNDTKLFITNFGDNTVSVINL